VQGFGGEFLLRRVGRNFHSSAAHSKRVIVCRGVKQERIGCGSATDLECKGQAPPRSIKALDPVTSGPSGVHLGSTLPRKAMQTMGVERVFYPLYGFTRVARTATKRESSTQEQTEASLREPFPN